jgi:hypothetical protein
MATTHKRNSDWIALLETANASKADKIPTGFKSREDWSAHYKISVCTFDRQWRGIFEREEFRVNANGRLVKKPFYRLIAKPR